MTDDESSPPFSRSPRGGGGPQIAWLLPLALTGLVVVLAWKLYESTPKPVNDKNAESRPVTARGDLAADEKATIDLFRAASPAVVQVTNVQYRRDFWGSNQSEISAGTGSGFVWDAQGYVVTNFHVVEKGDAFTVTFADQSVFDATRVGTDPVHDLAVLKIDPKGKSLPALPIGSSKTLLVGQKVFAIGNPFGLEQTLTTGVIGGLGREIMSLARTPIQGVIQTDAAINPGNSGGPLLDSAGRVIGMNTQIASPSGGSAGVGFAIPVDTINRIVPSIIRTGHFERAGLGISEILDGVVDGKGRRGVIFCSFAASSAAARAGMKPSEFLPDGRLRSLGDAIVAIDGQAVESRADLFRILDSREIGQEVSVNFLREGKEVEARVKLVGVQ